MYCCKVRGSENILLRGSQYNMGTITCRLCLSQQKKIFKFKNLKSLALENLYAQLVNIKALLQHAAG